MEWRGAVDDMEALINRSAELPVWLPDYPGVEWLQMAAYSLNEWIDRDVSACVTAYLDRGCSVLVLALEPSTKFIVMMYSYTAYGHIDTLTDEICWKWPEGPPTGDVAGIVGNVRAYRRLARGRLHPYYEELLRV
jgi:hypothetical protein